MSRTWDTIVIGAGPAGLAAATQLARTDQSVLVLERKRLGGLLWNANLVENYPGFPGGIGGQELASLMVEQARQAGVRFEMEEVMELTEDAVGFVVVGRENEWKTRTVILAAGTCPKKPIFRGLETLGQGAVEYEVADLPENLEEKEVLVVGGGDAAFDHALNIVSRGGKAVICHKGERAGALALLVRRASEEKSIDVLAGVALEGCEPGGRWVLASLSSGEVLDVDHILLACGRVANDRLLAEPLPRGLFPIGDMVNGHYRQAAIAVGDGLRAAMRIEEMLRGEDREPREDEDMVRDEAKGPMKDEDIRSNEG
ncbi:MAG: NAD(P)/FAD-dependent oxidoreductase [Thermoplasmata archaeon]|nr:NAD(P)/FAD-dependent oxidoreductase [Thermoplasmata archaeon]